MPSFSPSVTGIRDQGSPVVTLAVRRTEEFNNENMSRNIHIDRLEDNMKDDTKKNNQAQLEDDATKNNQDKLEDYIKTNIQNKLEDTKMDSHGKIKDNTEKDNQEKLEDNAKLNASESKELDQREDVLHHHIELENEAKTTRYSEEDISQELTIPNTQDKKKDDVTHLAKTEHQRISSGHNCDGEGIDSVSDKADRETSRQKALTDNDDTINQMMLKGNHEEPGILKDVDAKVITQRKITHQEKHDERNPSQEKDNYERNGEIREPATHREPEILEDVDAKVITQRKIINREKDDEGIQSQDIERNGGIKEQTTQRDKKEEDEDMGKVLTPEENGWQEEDVERNNVKNVDNNVDENEALDGGWGYFVLAGTVVVMLSIGIMSNCFGILFLDLLNQFGASSTEIAGIFNTEAFFWSASNLVGASLAERFGWRVVAAFGGLFIAVGLGASAFATSTVYLFFSHSFVTGLGTGLSCLVSFAIIPQYFKRLRGRANAFMTAGICMGGTFGPPVITYLQEEFGYKAATVIIATFLLNNLVAALVYHPVSWHRPRQKPIKKSLTSRNKSGDGNHTINSKKEVNGEIESRKNEYVLTESEMTVENNVQIELKENTPSKTCHKEAEQNILPVKNYDSEAGRAIMGKTEPAKTVKTNSNILSIVKEVFISMARNMKILRNLSVAAISVAGAFIMGLFLNLMMFVPFAMEFEGYSKEQTSWGLSIFNLLNLISRFVTSPLSDIPGYSLRWSLVCHSTLATVSIFVFAFMSELVWINVVLGVAGYAIGSCLCLYPLLMVQTVGTEKYMAALAVYGMLQGVWLVGSGPLMGLIRDVTGSFRFTLCVIASTGIVPVTMLLILPMALRRDAAKEEKERLRKEEKEG